VRHGDVSRGERATRREVTKGIRKILDCLDELMPANSKRKAREGGYDLCDYCGAVMLPRAVDDPDLSNEILKTARTFIVAAAR
jgi:hypothetical protein